MQKQKSFQLAVIGVLAFAVIIMSIGFAAYSQTLNISGTTTVAANKWSVHFVTNSFQVAQDSVQETSVDVSDTTVTYAATLTEPGDKFAFSINVINDGTFDALLKKVTLTPLTAAQQKYLTYTLKYDNTNTYTTTTDGLNIALPHNTGANTKNVTVTVQYVQPQDASDLPAQSVDISLTASLDYDQDL